MEVTALANIDELPLSWTRTHLTRPRWQAIKLPLSGLTWLAYATLPSTFTLTHLQREYFADSGLLLRGCSLNVASKLAAAGWETIRVGIEGIIDLSSDSLSRRSIRKMTRAALRFGSVIEVPWNPAAVARLRWLAREARYGARPQLRYLFRTVFEPETRLFVFVDTADEWQGALLLTQPTPTTAVTELMLRRVTAPSGIMEALFTTAGQHLYAEGCRTFSLNEVPFYHLEQDLRPLERLVTLVGRQMTAVYNAHGLYRFKAKFADFWRPVYLCARPRLSIRALVDLFTVSGCLELAASGLYHRRAA
jgi:lysylphosphatidylglycerol synthetase-like protein (DUF2156 family)